LTTARPLDVDRVQEALSLIEQGSLDEAIERLTPLVPKRRFTRPSGRLAEELEVSEIKGWLQSALDDPGSGDAPFYVERAYYKLRRHRPTDGSAGR
jgi:hypothetical protein